MQKVLVTYLSLLILFQSTFTNVDVAFEINDLMEDYQLHKVKYGDNITTFFSKHFGNLKEEHKEQHKQEHKEHKHPANDFSNHIQVDYAFYNNNFAPQNPIEIIQNKSNFYYKDKFSTFEKQKVTVHSLFVGNFVKDYQDQFLADMSNWIQDDLIRYKEDLFSGLESAPQAFSAMLSGHNFGKTIVQVGNDPTTSDKITKQRAGDNVLS